MMAMGMAPLMMALVFSQNMGGDILDYLPSADYWSHKGVEVTETAMMMELGGGEAGDADKLVKQLGSSKYKTRREATEQLRKMGAQALPALRKAAQSSDVEVSSRARELIEKVPSEMGKAGEVRRLMAIRTLGELGTVDALPTLREQTSSKEHFVADYAKAAISDIEKGTYQRPPPDRKLLDRDLAALPATCSLVAQSVIGNTRPETAGMWLSETERTMMNFGAQMGGAMPEFRNQMLKGFLGVLEQVGNVRLQSITFGLDGTIGDQQGFMLLILRGEYDADAVKKWMLQSGMSITTSDGVDFYSPEEEVQFALVSNNTLVFAAGANPAELPGRQAVSALKAEKTELQLGKAMVDLVKGVNNEASTWAVAKITDSYRKMPFSEPFDSATMTLKHQEKGMEILLSAVGKDAELVKKSVDAMRMKQQESLAELKKQMAMAGPMVEMMKPAQQLLEGIKMDSDGKTANVKVSIPDDVQGIMSMPMMWMGMMIPMQRQMRMHEHEIDMPPPAQFDDPVFLE